MIVFIIPQANLFEYEHLQRENFKRWVHVPYRFVGSEFTTQVQDAVRAVMIVLESITNLIRQSKRVELSSRNHMEF